MACPYEIGARYGRASGCPYEFGCSIAALGYPLFLVPRDELGKA